MTGAPLRRLIHAATAGTVVLIPLTSFAVFRGAVIGVAVVALAVDVARLSMSRFGTWLAVRVPVFRPREARQLSGATWLWAGYAIAAWFPERAVAPAILVGALADPAASLVGLRVGILGKKSWVGSGAFALATVALVLAIGPGLREALFAALVGALVERWPGRLDDNLLVAPAVALAIAVSS